MSGKVTTYKDQCGVMHWNYQPYYSESEIVNDWKMEIVDRIEGNLIDNLLCVDSYGNYHIFKETYVNCWTSTLINATENLSNDEVLEMWDNMRANFE